MGYIAVNAYMGSLAEAKMVPVSKSGEWKTDKELPSAKTCDCKTQLKKVVTQDVAQHKEKSMPAKRPRVLKNGSLTNKLARASPSVPQHLY
eukprot:1160470-Pelagomonas_calceolata.AAC.3